MSEREGSYPYTYADEEPQMYPDVNSPDHYTVGGFEAVDVIMAKLGDAQFIAYCKGNALKYLMRANYKGKHDEDLLKAHYYLNKAKEIIERGEKTEDRHDG